MSVVLRLYTAVLGIAYMTDLGVGRVLVGRVSVAKVGGVARAFSLQRLAFLGNTATGGIERYGLVGGDITRRWGLVWVIYWVSYRWPTLPTKCNHPNGAWALLPHSNNECGNGFQRYQWWFFKSFE